MTDVRMEVTKTQITCYKMRWPDGENRSEWADITIDDMISKGRISIASDFGNWSYYWGSPGPNFKLFLAGLNIQYTAGKFGADKFFDLDKTLKSLNGLIVENQPTVTIKDVKCPNPGCNDGEVEKETGGAGACSMCGGNGWVETEDDETPNGKIRKKLQEEFDLLMDVGSRSEYIRVMQEECEEIMKLCNHTPNIEYSIDVCFQQFWDKFFVKFQAIMYQEGGGNLRDDQKSAYIEEISFPKKQE